MSRNIRLATFNVHNFTDASGTDNFDRVKALIKAHDVDVICLQEAGKCKARKLHGDLGVHLYGFAERANCAIISKRELTPLNCLCTCPAEVDYKESHVGRKKTHWPRYVTAVLGNADQTRPLIRLTCLHLGHRLEPKRMREMDQIKFDLHNAAEAEADVDVLTGDFNALTLSDYDEDELNRVSEVRRSNRWEPPMEDVTRFIRREGYFDARDEPGVRRSGPLSTCRFNTRIDYFFVKQRDQKHGVKVVRLEHVDDSASDHNMVIMDLEINPNPQ